MNDMTDIVQICIQVCTFIAFCPTQKRHVRKHTRLAIDFPLLAAGEGVGVRKLRVRRRLDVRPGARQTAQERTLALPKLPRRQHLTVSPLLRDGCRS